MTRDDEKYLVHYRTIVGHYSNDIIDIPGLSGVIYDDGRVALFCGSPCERLMMPPGTREIITDIYARATARKQTDLWLKKADEAAWSHDHQI